jgi:hypothetical protein
VAALKAAQKIAPCSQSREQGVFLFSPLSHILQVSEQRLDLVNTLAADALFTKINHVIRVAAELAGGVILLENDAVVIRENLKRILFLNVHNLAQGLGEHDAS